MLLLLFHISTLLPLLCQLMLTSKLSLHLNIPPIVLLSVQLQTFILLISLLRLLLLQSSDGLVHLVELEFDGLHVLVLLL